MLLNFSDLYERHAKAVYRFALYLCGDPTLADDLVAETFVRAWTTPSEVRLVTLKAYLFTITRHLFLTEQKRRAHHVPLDDSLPDPSIPSDVRAAKRSELRVVLRALRDLPEMDRSAVIMRAIDELSYEEIAAILGLTVASAKVKVHRARIKLMKKTEI